MELKRQSKQFVTYLCDLLIVPYGIETPTFNVSQRTFNNLLIVPYGIETIFNATRLERIEISF